MNKIKVYQCDQYGLEAHGVEGDGPLIVKVVCMRCNKEISRRRYDTAIVLLGGLEALADMASEEAASDAKRAANHGCIAN